VIFKPATLCNFDCFSKVTVIFEEVLTWHEVTLSGLRIQALCFVAMKNHGLQRVMSMNISTLLTFKAPYQVLVRAHPSFRLSSLFCGDSNNSVD
jgi:hypothetical protein